MGSSCAAQKDPPADVRRTNGFSRPPEPKQVFVISVVVADLIFWAALMAPMLWLHSKTLFWILGFIFLSAWGFMAVCGVITLSIDPIDYYLDERLGPDDVDEYALECHYCSNVVEEESKHCWECRKCVSEFDHHCPYLNTCIGGKNYQPFFATVISLLIMLSLMVSAGIVLMVEIAVSMSRSEESMSSVISDTAVIVFLSLEIVVNVPAFCATVCLLAFHCMLVYRNITTYDYLTGKVSKRKADRREKLQAAEAAPPPQEEEEEEEEPEDEEETGADAVFVSMMAEEEDGDLKRSFSSFMYGSGISQAQAPSGSPSSGMFLSPMSSMPASAMYAPSMGFNTAPGGYGYGFVPVPTSVPVAPPPALSAPPTSAFAMTTVTNTAPTFVIRKTKEGMCC